MLLIGYKLYIKSKGVLTLSFGTAAAADGVAVAAVEALVLLAAAAVVDSAGQRSLGSGRR